MLCARPGALHLSMLSSTLEQQIQSAPTVWDISTHGTTSSRTAELLWGDPAVCPDTHTGIAASPHLCWPLSVQVRGSCPAETPTGQGPVLGRAGSDQYWEEILSSSSCCFQITVGCYSTGMRKERSGSREITALGSRNWVGVNKARGVLAVH